MTEIEFHPVNKVKHYNLHPSGVECIDIIRHLSFGVANAIKYVWRADNKGSARHDLEKSLYYLDDEAALSHALVAAPAESEYTRIIGLAERYAEHEENPARASAVVRLVNGAYRRGSRRDEFFSEARSNIVTLLEELDETA